MFHEKYLELKILLPVYQILIFLIVLIMLAASLMIVLHDYASNERFIYSTLQSFIINTE